MKVLAASQFSGVAEGIQLQILKKVVWPIYPASTQRLPLPLVQFICMQMIESYEAGLPDVNRGMRLLRCF